jgi:DNA polymerase III sliding clamp (beta) subunit (PCNA family)
MLDDNINERKGSSMLTIPRSTVRQFQRVLCKAGLLKRVKTKPPAVLRLIANRDGLILQGCDAQISVSMHVPGIHEPETLALPIACLSDWSDRIEGDVTVTIREKRAVASWTDRNVPTERDYEQIPFEQVPVAIPFPTDWSENTPEIFKAVRDAMRITDSGSTRYALNCIQLAGTEGEIASTDSHQALIHRGLAFPWTEKVLIPACRVFESSDLPQDGTVKVGKTESHVHFQIGAWTIAFATQTEGRFPDVHQILPNDAAVKTKLQLDCVDAQFVVQRLDQLPIEDDLHKPITVDLNGSVVIRSRLSSDSVPTELLLRRSQRTGEEVRVAMDRRYFKQAIALGFAEIGITSKEGPAICRDARRDFIWAVLEAGSAVPPSEQVHQVDSHCVPETQNGEGPRVAPVSSAITNQASRRRSRAKSHPAPQIESSTSSPSERPNMPKTQTVIPTESELITQLLDLRTQLREIEQSIVTIARHLRGRQKRQQLMKATLASLKQLQTLDV